MTDPTGKNPLIDYEQLEPFIDIGLDEFRGIFHDVIEETPARLQEIAKSLAADDFPAAKRTSHTLRGMLSNFGCKQLCAKLFALEHGEPTTPAQAPAKMQELHTLWTLSLGAILEWEKSVS
ncbi:MAG: Hpt domain-containing protein [Luteolibacter sp.]